MRGQLEAFFSRQAARTHTYGVWDSSLDGAMPSRDRRPNLCWPVDRPDGVWRWKVTSARHDTMRQVRTTMHRWSIFDGRLQRLRSRWLGSWSARPRSEYRLGRATLRDDRLRWTDDARRGVNGRDGRHGSREEISLLGMCDAARACVRGINCHLLEASADEADVQLTPTPNDVALSSLLQRFLFLASRSVELISVRRE